MDLNYMSNNSNGVVPTVDKRHQFIFSKVADAMKINRSTVEEIGRSRDNLHTMDKFFQPGGPLKLIWFYSRQQSSVSTPTTDEPEIDFDESGTVKSAQSAQTHRTAGTTGTASQSATSGTIPDNEGSVMSSRSPRSANEEYQPMLFVTTDPTKFIVHNGICVYFLKEDKKVSVTPQNIEDAVTFGALSGANGMLEELRRRLGSVLLPLMKVQTDWGELTQDITVNQSREVNDFLENMDKFVTTVNDAITSLTDVVRLQPPKKNFGIVANAKSYARAIQRPEVIFTFEETVSTWIKQIEVLLGEVTAIREENDDSGPATELEYWKSRMAKFNSITDQLRGRRCRIVLGTLKAAKSNLLTDWQVVDMKITDAANEAKVCIYSLH